MMSFSCISLAPPHQRGPDLALLSTAHLHRWRPAAAVVTGDLTEAKDEAGRGGQRHEEWQVGCTANLSYARKSRGSLWA